MTPATGQLHRECASQRRTQLSLHIDCVDTLAIDIRVFVEFGGFYRNMCAVNRSDHIWEASYAVERLFDCSNRGGVGWKSDVDAGSLA